MARPMLGDLELEQVQLVETGEDQVITHHPVPGLEGGFLQSLGRRGTRLRLAGVLTRPDTAESLAELRSRFHAAEPVAFVSDISTATLVDRVLIEEMEVRELAGRPSRFEYSFALREFVEPEPVDTEDVIIPPPPPPDVENGKLSVTVVAEAEPGFDMDRVRVTVRGTEEGTGAELNRVLTTRTSANVWFEEPFPAGQYTVEALVGDNRTPTGQHEVLSGAATVQARGGQTASVTSVLRRGGQIGTVFVITFHFDKAFIEPCMRHVLHQVAKYAQDHPGERMLCIGHTDLTGSSTYNQALSERRARATYAMLTFGSNPQASVNEWNELRQARPAGEIDTVKDTWGTREYQHMLQDLGYFLGNVGKDPELTDDAVRRFQQVHGLTDDGVVDDDTWLALIEEYLGKEPIGIPVTQFITNADARGCDQGPLRWLGCSEQDPVRDTEQAWRPNRRAELMFVHEPAMPCQVPKPVTLELVPDGAGGGGWCLDDGTATTVNCFVTPADEPCPSGPSQAWCRAPAEPGSFAVKGTITFDDGTPFAEGKYVLTAPDGQYMDGEVATTNSAVHAGTPIQGRTKPDGSFTYDIQKGPGTYIVEVDGPFVARMRDQPLAAATGNAVCFRLDGSKDADIVIVDRTVAAFQPSVTAPETVVVRKPHTSPARQPVVLRASTAFVGSGTFTRSSDRVRFFDAVAGGSEITFDGTDNVFTDLQLGVGHTIFAEGALASTAVGDVTLTLALTVNGTPAPMATTTMTSVELTLDIAALPDAAGKDRGDLSSTDKANPGRFLQLQAKDRQARRARLTVRPPQPPAFAGALVLRRLTTGVDMFTSEAVTSSDVPIGAEHPVPSPVPAAGVQVFCEGATVSTSPGDTGFQLGIAGGEADGDRVAVTVAAIEMIRADNTVFPIAGDDACHMVSKFVTDKALPGTATFDGPVPTPADPDTFRVQIRGLPPGTAPVARLLVTRPDPPPGTQVYTHDFPMLESAAGAVRDFRSDQHIRLVSNDIDDAHLAHQTAKVRLADDVAAVVLIGGNQLGSLRLPVGRPPIEDGPKAIRTCDVSFITHSGVASDPERTVVQMSENWAQVAIRFNLLSKSTFTPVANVLSVDFAKKGATAAANGTLTVDVTPAGTATATRVVANVAAGDNAEVIARKLAAEVSNNAGLKATRHRFGNQFLVMVNRGKDVTFANVHTTVQALRFLAPPLNFKEIELLEWSVLTFNFAGTSVNEMNIFVVGNDVLLMGSVTPGATPDATPGVAAGDVAAADGFPGIQNVAILQQRAADGTGDYPLVAGHEMGHPLLNGGNNIHSKIATNLLHEAASPGDAIDGPKRLSDQQNTDARTQSGPGAPDSQLLHK